MCSDLVDERILGIVRRGNQYEADRYLQKECNAKRLC